MNVPKDHSPSTEFLSSKMYCTAKRIYQGGEKSDAAFFVYFADTVRLQQLVNASAFFVCQVVSGDVLYVEADGLL